MWLNFRTKKRQVRYYSLVIHFHSVLETMWVLWPSSGKFFCSARSKQTKVIKKQNRMSHLIDTELFGENRTRSRRQSGQQAGKDTKKTRKGGKGLIWFLCVYTCLTEGISCISRRLCVLQKGFRGKNRPCVDVGVHGSPNFRCNYPDRDWELSELDRFTMGLFSYLLPVPSFSVQDQMELIYNKKSSCRLTLCKKSDKIWHKSTALVKGHCTL